MADSLKEFYNNSSITYTQLKAGVTIESNSASEEALLKDLCVESVTPVKFKVNNFDILEVDSNELQKFEGNEIIPASSSLIAYTDAEAIWNVAIGVASGTTYWETIYKPEFSNSLANPVSVSRDLKTFSPAISSGGNQIWYIDGKFYHTTQQGRRDTGNDLYVRDGLTGTDSVAITGTSNSSVAWDGKRYFIKVSTISTAWQLYDTQTGSTIAFNSSVSLPVIAASTTQWDCHDGILFFLRNANGVSCSLIDYRDVTNIEQNYLTISSNQALYSGNNYVYINIMRNYNTGGFTLYYPGESGTYDSVYAYEFTEPVQATSAIFNRTIVWSDFSNFYGDLFASNKIYLGQGENQVAIRCFQRASNQGSQTFIMSSGGVAGINNHVYGTVNGAISSFQITMASIDSITDAQFGTAKIKASGVKTTG